MKNNIKAISLFIAVVLLFAGCGVQKAESPQTSILTTQPTPTTVVPPTTDANRGYISIQGGQYVLHPDNRVLHTDNHVLPPDNMNIVIGIMYPEYQSVKELQAAIQNGDFTKQELAAMKKYFPKTAHGGIKLPIRGTLYEPIVPAEYKLEHVRMNSSDICFTYSRPGEADCRVFWGKGARDEYYGSEMAEYKDILADELDPERNAKVYYTEEKTFKKKVLAYTVETVSGSLQVYEVYYIDPPYDIDWEPKTVPDRICLFGNWKDGPFWATISKPSNRMSLEELSQFGMKPYVETDAA